MNSVYQTFVKNNKPCLGSSHRAKTVVGTLPNKIKTVMKFMFTLYVTNINIQTTKLGERKKQVINSSDIRTAFNAYQDILKAAQKVSNSKEKNTDFYDLFQNTRFKKIAYENRKGKGTMYSTNSVNIKKRSIAFMLIMERSLINLGIAIERNNPKWIESSIKDFKEAMNEFIEFVGIASMRSDIANIYGKFKNLYKIKTAKKSTSRHHTLSTMLYNNIKNAVSANAHNDFTTEIRMKFGLSGFDTFETEEYNETFDYQVKTQSNLKNKVHTKTKEIFMIANVKEDIFQYSNKKSMTAELEDLNKRIRPSYGEFPTHNLFYLYMLIKHRKWHLLEKAAVVVMDKYNKQRYLNTKVGEMYVKLNFCPKVTMRNFHNVAYSNYLGYPDNSYGVPHSHEKVFFGS